MGCTFSFYCDVAYSLYNLVVSDAKVQQFP